MSDLMAQTLKKVGHGHPDQCQTIRSATGTQCEFAAVENGRMCIMHGGAGTLNSARVNSLNMYRLKKYQKRVEEFSGSEKLRSVDEEIGILRMVLEEIVVSCESSVDLQLYSQKISDLVRDITKCVQVADKLATKSGLLIGRAEALTIADKVVSILTNHITDENVLLQIADQISDAFLTKVESSTGSKFGPINATASIENFDS